MQLLIKQLLGMPGSWPAPGRQLSKAHLPAPEEQSAMRVIIRLHSRPASEEALSPLQRHSSSFTQCVSTRLYTSDLHELGQCV